MKHEIVHVTPGQLEELRQRLKRRAWTLMDEISAGLRSGGLEIEAREPESGDVESSVTAAAAVRDTGELLAVEEALVRMEAGTYGLCAECGSAMPWPRLSAMPEALRCVRCEAARESRAQPHATL